MFRDHFFFVYNIFKIFETTKTTEFNFYFSFSSLSNKNPKTNNQKTKQPFSLNSNRMATTETQQLLPPSFIDPTAPTAYTAYHYNAHTILPTHNIPTPQELQKQNNKKIFYIKLLLCLTVLLLLSVVVLSLFAFGPLQPAQPVAISYFSNVDNRVYFLSVCNLTAASPRVCPSPYPSYTFSIHPISGSTNHSFHLRVNGKVIGGNLYLYSIFDTPSEVWLYPAENSNNYYMGVTVPGQDYGGLLLGNNEDVSVPDWAPPGSTAIQFSIIPYIPNILF